MREQQVFCDQTHQLHHCHAKAQDQRSTITHAETTAVRSLYKIHARHACEMTKQGQNPAVQIKMYLHLTSSPACRSGASPCVARRGKEFA